MTQAGGYRTAAEGAAVTLGPLPFRGVHFLFPIVFIGLGLVVFSGVVMAALPSAETLLRCKRAGDAIQCEQWKEKKLAGYVNAPVAQVRYVRSTRNSSDGLAIGNTSYTNIPNAKGSVAQLTGLAPGAEVVIDVTRGRPWVALVFTSLFGPMLMGMGIWALVRILGRNKHVVVHVTPRTLEIAGQAPIARLPGDPVRIGKISSGRGEMPIWGVLYGPPGVPADALGRWMTFNGNLELEAFAAQLRQLLVSVPRA